MTNTPDKEPGRLFRMQIDPDVLEVGLACVPDWVPAEYREFYNSYGSFVFDDGSWLGPDHPPSDPFSVRSGYARMRKAAEAFGGEPDVWFPVADMEDCAYAVYHRKDDGSVEFGSYHFEDQEFLDGPYPSMTAWMRTYGVDL